MIVSEMVAASDGKTAKEKKRRKKTKKKRLKIGCHPDISKNGDLINYPKFYSNEDLIQNTPSE